MPRIRTIKPEFCTSEQIVECSTNARLTFVLMWGFCDDAGRHPANVKRLKMEIFPGDPFTDKHIRGFVDELIRAKLLIEYQHESVAFWQVTGWKHQKIDRPSYKYPPLDADGIPLSIDERSTSDRRAIDEHSPPEGNGVEGNGVEGNGVEDCGFDDKASNPLECGEKTVFTFVISDGSEFSLTPQKLAEYQKTFPELDLEREFRCAAQWLRDNPRKRKTRNGMHAFLGSWLSRSQNRGGACPPEKPGPVTFAQQRIINSQAAQDAFLNRGKKND